MPEAAKVSAKTRCDSDAVGLALLRIEPHALKRVTS